MLLYNRKIKLVVKFLNFSIFSILLSNLVGCQQFHWVGWNNTPVLITPITEISQKKEGSRIYLQGKVTRRAPFLGSGAYQLEDNTGEIWIITQDILPVAGELILVQGEIEYQSLAIAPQNWEEFYIVELKKLKVKPE